MCAPPWKSGPSGSREVSRYQRGFSPGLHFLARQFPRLGIFPGDVDGVIKVQEEALAPIKKSEAKDVVVEERSRRTDHDVEHAEAALALGDDHLRAERGVAVHVVDVVGERGVGVVEEGADTNKA